MAIVFAKGAVIFRSVTDIFAHVAVFTCVARDYIADLTMVPKAVGCQGAFSAVFVCGMAGFAAAFTYCIDTEASGTSTDTTAVIAVVRMTMAGFAALVAVIRGNMASSVALLTMIFSNMTTLFTFGTEGQSPDATW
jgi:hypothetical protein